MSLVIFRRDLRIIDNTALTEASRASKSILPIFILDPAQTDPSKNSYFSQSAYDFMIESLIDLDKEIYAQGGKLHIFKGAYNDVIEKLVRTRTIDAVYVNKDYTPFSRARDARIEELCKSYSIPFFSYDDALLISPDILLTGNGKPYTVFTPFKNKALTYSVPKPGKDIPNNFVSSGPPGSLSPHALPLDSKSNVQGRYLRGGRTEGLALLKRIAELTHYETDRNIPARESVSHLSPHHKFGTLSVRESYSEAMSHPSLKDSFVSELYWRDFFTYTAYHFPRIFTSSFQERGNHLEWINDEAGFTAWKEGRTGYPLVDAGMRELVHTGYMHGRVRMVTASFLTKNLLIDWRWGERFFAQHLVDYDPAVNNGNWQWAASVGVDPRPLRIFNPWNQTKKYDPSADYIKTWVPELRDIPSKMLASGKQTDFSALASYPSPCVDHTASYHRAMSALRKATQVALLKGGNKL